MHVRGRRFALAECFSEAFSLFYLFVLGESPRRFNAPSRGSRGRSIYRELNFPYVGKPISTSEVESVIYLCLSYAAGGALALGVCK